MATTPTIIVPDWPAPPNIHAFSTTRLGGFSLPPYQQLNLGNHVGDEQLSVTKNRQLLISSQNLPQSPYWLKQIHSTRVINTLDWHADIEADASFSTSINHICTVMTADCLPILLCDIQGNHVAAIHVGWRGLLAGIIENTVKQLACPPNELLCWLGPAIGPTAFEVGADVHGAFINTNSADIAAFTDVDKTHWLADLYLLAHHRLQRAGISAVYGGNFCSFNDRERFFSYRRDGITGRMATMIWIEGK